MSGDSRKDFLLATTGNYFSIAVADLGGNKDTECLNNFLDDGNIFTLAAKKSGKGVSFTNKVPCIDCIVKLYQTNKTSYLKYGILMLQVDPGGNDDKMLVFFKIKPEVITPDNIHSNIFVSTMIDSPVSALYHAVQKVFAPVLLQNEKWSQKFDPKLQSMLSDLEAGLGSMMRKNDPSFRGGGRDTGPDSLGGKHNI